MNDYDFPKRWILKGEMIWIVDAHGHGKRLIVRADEKLTAFVEIEAFDWGLHRATTAVGRRLMHKGLIA